MVSTILPTYAEAVYSCLCRIGVSTLLHRSEGCLLGSGRSVVRLTPLARSYCKAKRVKLTKVSIETYMDNQNTMEEANITNTNNSEKKIEYKLFPVPFSYRSLAIDYAARSLILALYQTSLINGWIFWLCQIIIIPVTVFIYTIDKSTKITGEIEKQERDKLPPNTKVGWSIQTTTMSQFIAVFTVLTGSYIAYYILNNSLETAWLKWIITITIFLGYAFYISVVYGESPRLNTPSPEADQISQYFRLEQIPKTKDLSSASASAPNVLSEDISLEVDRNDERITFLEITAQSIFERADTYTLESTLFGALAFSGFLSLVSSDTPTLTFIRKLNLLVSELETFIFGLQLRQIVQSISHLLSNSDTLLGLVAVETLLCSMFFVLVIIYRLQFSDAMKSANYAIRLARKYNDKEEETYALQFQFDSDNALKIGIESRLDFLTKKIADAGNKAQLALDELAPTIIYMQVFRNLGIATFVLILLTSSCLISPYLTVTFSALTFLAYIYSSVEQRIRIRTYQSHQIGMRQLFAIFGRAFSKQKRIKPAKA